MRLITKTVLCSVSSAGVTCYYVRFKEITFTNLNWEPSFLFSSPILTNYRGSLACFCLRLSPLAYFYNRLNDVSTRCLVVSLVLMALSVFLLVYFQHRSSPTRRRVTADTDLSIEL